MKSLFILLLGLSLITGCKSLIGTDTGNPIHSPTNGEEIPDTPAPITGEGTSVDLVQTICKKLSSCNSEIGETACSEDLYVQGRVDGIFTLPFSQMTFEDLHHKEKNLEVVASATSYFSCAHQVLNMSCSDPAINVAYQPDQPTPFLGGAALLAFKEPCINIFSVSTPEEEE